MKQKLKIMYQKPDLADEEIRNYMDFDALLRMQRTRTGVRRRILKWSTGSILIAALVCCLFVFTRQSQPTLPATPAAKENVEPRPRQSVPYVPPSVPKYIPAPANQTPEEKVSTLQRKPERKTSTPKAESISPEIAPGNNTINVYVQAEPVDGYPALYEYFHTHLLYPADAVKDSLQGVVTVSFVINAEGKAEKIEVRQSLGEPFEREAKRLIENMPLWKPAMLQGKPVASKMSLPLTFAIQKKENQK